MQVNDFFHISTKEERKKVAKKERRKVTAATAAHLSTFLRTGGNWGLKDWKSSIPQANWPFQFYGWNNLTQYIKPTQVA